jgi:molybdopterin-dependent oxidoreductase alpha subunit
VTDRDDGAPAVRPPETVAAGVGGVVWGLRHALRHMGPRRSVSTLLKVNQTDGFDCPGCAWPEPDHRSIAEFCENGAKAVADEATRARADASFFSRHTIADLASQSDHWLGQQGRLTQPMHKPAGSDRYQPIDWDGAFALIAREFHELDSPDEAVFYTSGRTSNEAAFLYQLFVRAFGTNNLPDCSNLCHESSGAALTETIGVGKGSVTLDDLYAADLIFVLGQNPGTNHPRMLNALERAKHNGAQIVAVNPLPEAGLLRFKNPQRPRGLVGSGTALADHFLQIRVNGDLALFRWLNRRLVESDVVDRAFVDGHCAGFDEFAAHARDTQWAEVAEATGLDHAEIERVFKLVCDSERIIVCWAMGLTQHRNAVPTIREIVNFLLLRGNIGRVGAGVCPVRGHSNVQGDRTMGIWEQPSAAFLDRLAQEFRFDPPRHHGHDVVESIRALRDRRARVLFAMGGNFVAASPDTDVTVAAIANATLTVHVSTKLNRSHVVTGQQALILPCLGRTERDASGGVPQFVTVEDSMGVVHASTGSLQPASDLLRSEIAIVCGLAQAVLGPASSIDWAGYAADYDRIRDAIERVIPGFNDFNRRVRDPGGFVLPHPPRDERRFPTPTGRAHFTVNQLDILRPGPGRLLLQTVRSHDQYNTTIYGLDDRYRGVRGGRRVVFVHPDDLAAGGLADGDSVDIVSEYVDGVERRAPAFRATEYPVAKGTCAAYFPETNVLVPLDSTADVSGTPTSKSIIVRLEKVLTPAE